MKKGEGKRRKTTLLKSVARNRRPSNSAWREKRSRRCRRRPTPTEFASASTVIFQNIVCTVNYTRIIKGTSVARLGRLANANHRQLRPERENTVEKGL